MLDLSTQVCPELFELICVLGELHCFRDVVRLVFADQFRQARVMQDAHADPAHMSFPLSCDERDPHPEGLARGGGPVVRKGIKGDVHMFVHVEMRGLGRGPGLHDHALGRDAVLREHLQIMGPGRFGGQLTTFQQDPGAGDLLHDLGPECDHLSGHLAQIVE